MYGVGLSQNAEIWDSLGGVGLVSVQVQVQVQVRFRFRFILLNGTSAKVVVFGVWFVDMEFVVVLLQLHVVLLIF